MSIAHSQVDVGVTPVDLLDGVDDPSSRPRGDVVRSLVVSNTGGTLVLLGGPGVTATDYGFALPAGEKLSLDLGISDRPWALTATADAGQLRLLHLGV